MAEQRKYWSVAGYEDRKHYKRKDGPLAWIKMPVDIGDSDLFQTFPDDRHKWKLIRLMLVAGETGNKIPAYDGGTFLKRKTGITPRFCDKLEELGIVCAFFDAPDLSIFSKLPEKSYRERLSTETDAETETKTEANSVIKDTSIDFVSSVLNRHRTSSETGSTLVDRLVQQGPPSLSGLSELNRLKDWSDQRIWNYATPIVLDRWKRHCDAGLISRETDGVLGFLRGMKQTISMMRLFAILEDKLGKEIHLPNGIRMPTKSDVRDSLGNG